MALAWGARRRSAALRRGRPSGSGDAEHRLFWQHLAADVAGSFGAGRAIALTLYATQARTQGPVAALHSAGLVLVAIALVGALAALALPPLRNTAMVRG